MIDIEKLQQGQEIFLLHRGEVLEGEVIFINKDSVEILGQWFGLLKVLRDNFNALFTERPEVDTDKSTPEGTYMFLTKPNAGG